MKKIVIPIVSHLLYDNIKKLFLCLFFLTPTLLLAQDIDLFQQFNGKYDFTVIGNTLNPGPNPCNILTESSADLFLSSTQTLVSANLYWSGSGGLPLSNYPGDYNVTLNGIPIFSERNFFLSTFIGRDFYGAYADVTDIVNAYGNGTYTLSDLDLTGNIFGGSPYCDQTVDYGGWSIIVVYENPTLPLNQISLFDGLEVVYENELVITLGPLNVASEDLAKIGFLAWEGDLPNPNNESLRINGTLMENALNPPDNQFNGTNTYTNSIDLYNMDLDVFDLEEVIVIGDASITIDITSDSDLVLINNLITSVNSELPDATIRIDDIGNFCADRNLDFDYTVFNINSTGSFPPNTPIAFYANNILIGQSQTTIELLTGEFESGTITLFIPTNTPDIFTLKAVIDDDGIGNGIVT